MILNVSVFRFWLTCYPFLGVNTLHIFVFRF